MQSSLCVLYLDPHISPGPSASTAAYPPPPDPAPQYQPHIQPAPSYQPVPVAQQSSNTTVAVRSLPQISIAEVVFITILYTHHIYCFDNRVAIFYYNTI